MQIPRLCVGPGPSASAKPRYMLRLEGLPSPGPAAAETPDRLWPQEQWPTGRQATMGHGCRGSSSCGKLCARPRLRSRCGAQAPGTLQALLQGAALASEKSMCGSFQ